MLLCRSELEVPWKVELLHAHLRYLECRLDTKKELETKKVMYRTAQHHVLMVPAPKIWHALKSLPNCMNRNISLSTVLELTNNSEDAIPAIMKRFLEATSEADTENKARKSLRERHGPFWHFGYRCITTYRNVLNLDIHYEGASIRPHEHQADLRIVKGGCCLLPELS